MPHHINIDATDQAIYIFTLRPVQLIKTRLFFFFFEEILFLSKRVYVFNCPRVCDITCKEAAVGLTKYLNL